MTPFSVALRRLACVLPFMFIAACASSGRGGATPEEQATRRAVERWQLLVDRQFEPAWEYLSAGVRSTKSREDYVAEMKARPLLWTGVEPIGAECEQDRCEVQVKVSIKAQIPGSHAGPITSSSPLSERWIKVGGDWYFLPNDFVEGGLR